MTTDEVIAKLLSEEHVDVIGEFDGPVQQMMQDDISELIGSPGPSCG
jgi:hypothetical protein